MGNIVDYNARCAVVNLLSGLFNPNFAVIDVDMVDRNIELATPQGFSKWDRTLRAGLCNYLLNNYCYILFSLVSSKEFRETCLRAVNIEIELYEKLGSYENEEDNTFGDKPFVIDLSKYSDYIFKKICNKISDSLSLVEGYDNLFLDFVIDLSDEDKFVIGYCMSNFMFLIRAFAKNNDFITYVKSELTSVREVLDELQEDFDDIPLFTDEDIAKMLSVG